MRTLVLIALSISILKVAAQETPMLTEESVPGIEKITTRQYQQDGLWGYINGGADLYFEYGFESVTVQDIRINGSDFKVDIYRMKSPEAAYGIYSVSRFRCLSSNIMNRYDCSTPYQYISASGEFFISIANSSGSEHDQELSHIIAGKYLDLIDTPLLDFPQMFEHPLFEQRWFDLKLISGPLGMQNGFMRWDRLFAGFEGYEAWVMLVDYEDKKFYVGLIKFHDPEKQELFFRQNKVFLVNPGTPMPATGEKYFAFKMADGFLLFEGEMTEKLSDELLNLSKF